MQFRRRREKKTDYSQRLALLKSGKPRLVVKRSNNGFRLQIIEFHPQGDRTLIEVTSEALKAYGWKGHAGSLPAAYLSGLLMGKMAISKGFNEVVPDLGLQMSVKGNSLYACLLGTRDAGLKINIGKEAVPNKDRIEGKHIAAYAQVMKNKSQEQYTKHFGKYIKQGLTPEKLPEHFNEIKKKLLEETFLEKVSSKKLSKEA